MFFHDDRLLAEVSCRGQHSFDMQPASNDLNDKVHIQCTVWFSFIAVYKVTLKGVTVFRPFFFFILASHKGVGARTIFLRRPCSTQACLLRPCSTQAWSMCCHCFGGFQNLVSYRTGSEITGWPK